MLPPSSRFVDPLHLKPIRLSVGTVQWLASELPASKASPLTPLLALQVARGQKNNRELIALGIPNAKEGNTQPSPTGRAFRDSLETLAEPEATLTLSELVAGEAPLSMKLVLGKGRAVVADIDEAGLSLSAPMSYADLIKVLSRRFENTTQTAPETSYWPAQLKALTFLFANEQLALDATVSAAGLEQRLAAAGISADEKTPLVEELARDGFIANHLPKEIALAEPSAFWLRRLATGEVAELLLVAHDEEGNSTEAPTQLRFAGAVGDRVTMVTLTGEELRRVAGDNPQEPAAVSFAVLEPVQLAILLEAFLGIS